jgi:hypothetical protein
MFDYYGKDVGEWSIWVCAIQSETPLKYKKVAVENGLFTYYSPQWRKHFALEFTTTPTPITEEAKSGEWMIRKPKLTVWVLTPEGKKVLEIDPSDLGQYMALTHGDNPCAVATIQGNQITNFWKSESWKGNPDAPKLLSND